MSAQPGIRVARQARARNHRGGAAEPPVGDAAVSDEPMEQVRAMFGIHESHGPVWRIRTWVGARIRSRTPRSAGPDQAWIREELKRLSSDYEAALGKGGRAG